MIMKLLIGGSSTFMFHLQDFAKKLNELGLETKLVYDADYADEKLAFVDGLPFDMTASMHHDLDRGNPLEVAWLSGAVARFGAALGIETPVNRTIDAALRPYAKYRDQ